jgi:hypothetical protein
MPFDVHVEPRLNASFELVERVEGEVDIDAPEQLEALGAEVEGHGALAHGRLLAHHRFIFHFGSTDDAIERLTDPLGAGVVADERARSARETRTAIATDDAVLRCER